MLKNAFAMSLAGALLCVLPALAVAEIQTTVTVTGGVTQVKLSDGFLSALSSLRVDAGTVEPTRIYEGTAAFPITGGAVDLTTAAGNIIHSGGLILETPKTRVRLESFIIDTTGKTPELTGLVVVNGTLVGRLVLFNLILPPGFSVPLKTEGPLLNLKDVKVELSSTAAGALNSVFDVKAFTAGFDIGTADVFAFADWH
jgi:hypothetical protein